MAEFLGVRESLQPSAAKRKRQPKEDASLSGVVSRPSATVSSRETNGPKQKKTKSDSSKIKLEQLVDPVAVPRSDQVRAKGRPDMTDKEMLEASNPPFSCSFCPGRNYSSKKTLAEHHRKIHQGGLQPAKEVVVSPIELKEAPPDSDDEPVINHDDDISEVTDDLLSIKSPSVKEDGLEWKPMEHVMLLDQIQSIMPNDDCIKYSTMAEKLDWTLIKVGSFSPNACKEEWQRISTKVRRFRTMSELLVDAKEWIKHPWNSFGKKVVKHPNMPKKPLTPYFRFFMAKRERYASKHPNLAVTDLTKELSKKYGSLSEKKKKKYIEAYNKEMDEWKLAMIKFRKEHPEVFDDEDRAAGSHSASSVFKHQAGFAPPKTTTAMQIFINEKYKDDKHSDQTRKQLYDFYKTQWSTKLSDGKKLKYIRMAIEAKLKYDSEMERYCLEHPEYQPRVVKTFLSKAEQKIKDRSDGKPEKPPGNGYSLFTIETLPQLTDLPNIERLGEVSRRWKKLSEEKREAYNLKADERNQEYKQKYSKYLQSLPEAERKKVEEEENEKNNKKKHTSNSQSAIGAQVLKIPGTVDRPQKPVAAVFLFINDKKDEYRRKYPNMDENELQRLLVKDYNCLSDRDKVKYKKLEEQEKEKIAKESVPLSNSNLKKAKKSHFPGEPPKPPHSGYQLFSKELLVELKEVKANERLQEIGKRWLALSEDEKKSHNKRKDILWVQYRKDLAKFKKSLSPKELATYESLNKSTSKKKKKVEEVAVEEESSEEEASEVEEEEEEKKDETSDSESSDSSSAADVAEEDGSASSEESEADEETASQMEIQLAGNGVNAQTQGKSKLSAKEVYDDESSDDDEDDSDSDLDSD